MSYYWKLLFDEECPYCRKFSRIVSRFDTNNVIELISLQDFYQTNKDIPLEDLQETLHMLGKENEILTGGDALQEIIKIVPAAKPIRWMMDSKFAKKSSDVFYKSLSRFHKRCRKCPGG